MEAVEWHPDCEVVLRMTRGVSKELGHQEIIRPLHILAVLLTTVRPASLKFPQPEWAAVKKAMSEVDPPFDEGDVVFSPGGQTPTTKRITLSAKDRAVAEGRPVTTDDFWAALLTHEHDLVSEVMVKLGLDVP